ncbi:MAG: FUSC family protein [Gelidibacter sp.]
MRQLFIILGFITAILAVILSVTPLSKLAYLPAIAALIFGLVAFYISKQKQDPKKSVQLVFLLTIISLSITTYKAIFTNVEVGNVEDLQIKEETSVEDSKELLENIEIEAIDLDESNQIDTSELDELEALDSIR